MRRWPDSTNGVKYQYERLRRIRPDFALTPYMADPRVTGSYIVLEYIIKFFYARYLSYLTKHYGLFIC